MTQASKVYDHPAYQARFAHGFGQNAAGASTAFSKYVAFTHMRLYAIQATLATAGTSTYTAWNGTAISTNINGDSFSVIHVFANGGTAATTTATHGPFALGVYNGTATSTQTATAGATVRVQLSGTGVTGNVQSGTNTAEGGILVYPGDTLHILRGTDATAVSAYVMELGLQPDTAQLTVGT